MRRRLGRLDGGGKSSWRRLGALLRTGVGGLTAAATSGLRFGIRVPRAGLRACRGVGRRLCGIEEGMWASSVIAVRRPEAELWKGLSSMSAYVSKRLDSCSRFLLVSVAYVSGF